MITHSGKPLKKISKEICGRYGITIAEPQKSRGTMTVEAYKEVKRLEDKLAYLSELSNVADGAEIPHKKSFLGKDKVIVSTEDFEKVEAEKKAAAVQLKTAEIQTAKAIDAARKNQECAEHLDDWKKKITEKEILAEERLGKTTNLLNRQTNINKILVDTEKEHDIYKREMDL